jgi:diadenosine tetraphosphate (Ap4A) HIT family hydrolase
LPDGVRLILIKKEEVTDRSDSSHQEATHLMRMTMMVGRSMYDVLDIKPMNYQDLETGASMSRVGRR